MKHILLISVLTVIGAGGVPLDTDHHIADKLIADTKLAMERKRQLQATIDKIIPVENAPLDPEYVAILEDYDRRKESFKLSHRDLQWHIVAKVMRGIEDLDERLGLIHTVRDNPLWRQLPATVAITSLNLHNWNVAKNMFIKHLKRVK